MADSAAITTVPPFGLTPKLVTEAARRLSALAVIVAILLVGTFLLHGLAQPGLPVVHDPVVRLVVLASVLASAALVALHHYQIVPDRTLLVIGMGFEVLIAFTISMTESAMPFDPDDSIRGISAVGAWVLGFGVLVPNRSAWALILPLLAATTWPLALFLNYERLGLGEVPAAPLIVLASGNYVSALLAYAASRYLFKFQAAAQDVRDLGSYHLVSRIGRGGMGEVWKAKHRMLARDAAIKIVGREMMSAMSPRDAATAVKRFQREANVTANLQSPHTVYLYDFGTSEAGDFYYVMELLDGITLQSLVTTFGPQPASRVVAILRQMCESLEEAHALGLVHRDLKPSNVMICKVALEYDFVKVLDFGLVKPKPRAGGSVLTLDGVFSGTPGYIAPEVALGERQVDGRADLYAVGCIAYFLLTGALVFPDLDPTATALKHLQATPDPPSSHTELPVPGALDRIVLDCLEKSPEHRPAGARALARRLEACGAPPWTPADAETWWRLHVPQTAVKANVL